MLTIAEKESRCIEIFKTFFGESQDKAKKTLNRIKKNFGESYEEQLNCWIQNYETYDIKVNYSVNQQQFCVNVQVVPCKTTIRNLTYFCEVDFEKKTGTKVTHGTFDCDNDIDTESSIRVRIEATKEVLSIPTLADYSDEEKLEFFL